ncbi:MAG TPA: type II secretion system F family protein [Candidatus Nanoarchaeia archaeon]|nr:type II secretion system F family protein [Candidatus Nanoarchaeia archaeon]
MSRVPLLIINPKSKSFTFLSPVSEKIALIFPGLKFDLQQAAIERNANSYASVALLNSTVFGALLGCLLFITFYFSKKELLNVAISKSLGIALAFFLLILLILLMYPKIIAGKKAEDIDNNLIFALKDLHLQVGAGVNLYHAIVNVSQSGYGAVSKEFEQAVINIEISMPMEIALERMAKHSKSHHLQKTLWQMVNALKAGASLTDTLASIITELKSEQYSRIKEYGQELNMMILMYLLFAIAIPSIGATLLIVLSGFGGQGVKPATFISFGIISMAIQLTLITFIKSRRPAISF